MEQGELIKKARKSKGLKQEDLSRKVGLSSSAVRNWEQGVNDISRRNFARLCKVLGMTAAEIGIREEELPEDDAQEPAAESRVVRTGTATARAVEEYLASPRGRTASDGIKAKLRDPAQTAFQALEIRRATWEDIDDVRRILERQEAGLRGPAVHAPVPAGARAVKKRRRSA